MSPRKLVYYTGILGLLIQGLFGCASEPRRGPTHPAAIKCIAQFKAGGKMDSNCFGTLSKGPQHHRISYLLWKFRNNRQEGL